MLAKLAQLLQTAEPTPAPSATPVDAIDLSPSQMWVFVVVIVIFMVAIGASVVLFGGKSGR